MKILLFNLGSIEHRIISWDVEGYKSLFEHEVILWGPIPDTEFTFNGKRVPIISISEPTGIKNVFDRLPDGWIPDIVTCDTSVLIYVPDIYLCPAKTILFTRDAWADTIFNRKLVELFDFVSHGIVDIKSYNKLQVNLLPLASFPVSLPDPGTVSPAFGKREIDVIAIANYNEGFYHERYKTLYKLAASNKNNLKIQFYNGLKRKEIHEYYKRSKIVIDWAHTLSNRSYEAALNGCLLFSHEDNTAMKSFWIPGEEYITYNDSNLYQQIVYYISNPEIAGEITGRTAKKIKSIPVSFGQYTLANIKEALNIEVNIQERIRRLNNLSKSDLNFRTATPFAYNYRYETCFPENWEALYFKRIDEAISSAGGSDDLVSPVIEAARIAFLTRNYELSTNYLIKLQKVLPDYAWIYYLLARIYFVKKDYNQALSSLEKAFDCGNKAPGLLQEYILPFIEKDLNCDGRRITDYIWQSVYNHKNEFQVRALFHLSADLCGDIYKNLNESENAKDAYYKAIGHIPVSDCVKKAAPLFIRLHDFKKLLEITEKGTEDSPFENRIVLYKAFALLQLGEKRNVFSVLRAHQKALKSFIATRKIKFLQKIIILPAIVGFLSRRAGMKFIQWLIDFLNK
jgi:tetratricopeptide (TPR) repeat protein